ncbi:MAG: iron-sulfur cluster repair di-iron protein [Eubacteriales bacterium]|nr:iron-sulfur cluster repair di-iron protein [Eubacteriales bacterium]
MKNTVITPDMLLGDVVSLFPPATRTFNVLDIDYCCQGQRPLSAALAEKDLDTEAFTTDLNQAYADYKTRTDHPVDPTTLSNEDLIQLILDLHHAPERLLLHDLDELINKILVVHFEHDERLLKALHRQFALLKMDLEEHFADEERVLFPAILSGDDKTTIKALIDDLEKDHDAAGDILKAIKTLTNGYQAPVYACPTFIVTYKKIQALTEDIFLHIHKENSILFPRFA